MNRTLLLVIGAALAGAALLGVVGSRVFLGSSGGDGDPADLQDDLHARDRFGDDGRTDGAYDLDDLPLDPHLQGRSDAVAGGTTPKAPAVREVLVKVVDASGVPLAGVWVTIVIGNGADRLLATDREGLLRVGDLPVDQPAWATLWRGIGKPEGLVSLSGEQVVLRAPNAISLRVRVLDAESGAELGHARWRVRGTQTALGTGSDARVASSAKGAMPRPYDVEAVPGYVDWVPDWSVPVSRYATALTAKHPLRREVDVMVVAVDKEDEDVRDAQVGYFWVAKRVESSPQTGAWMLGGIPLRGVPFFAGIPLTVRVAARGGLHGDASVVLPDQSHDPVEVKVVLKRGPGPDLADTEIPWTDDDLPYEESPGAPDAPKNVPAALSGILEVQVLRANGRPADGAGLRIAGVGSPRTDAEGYVRLERVLAGEYEVALHEPGLVPCGDVVQVLAGTTARLTLHEPDGGTLTVTVTDEEGRGLPFARLQIETPSRLAWVDLDPTGVQRVDPFTDEEGKRVLNRVEPGATIVRAAWGNRRGQAQITVRDRAITEAKVILH